MDGACVRQPTCFARHHDVCPQPQAPRTTEELTGYYDLLCELGFEQLFGSEINENPRRFILRNCISTNDTCKRGSLWLLALLHIRKI